MLRKDDFPAHRQINPNYSGHMSYYKKALFGIPFVIAVPNPKEITYKQLYEIMYSHLQRYLKTGPSVVATVTPKFDDDETESDEETNDQEKSETQDEKATVPLFTIRAVDNFGHTDKEIFNDDQQPLHLDAEVTFAVVFQEHVAEVVYDDTKEKVLIGTYFKWFLLSTRILKYMTPHVKL
jgi:hypothetical protein